MRILWLSPWLRPLAREYAEQLRARGDEILLITSDQHPQRCETREWELVLDPRPKTARTWPQFVRGYRRARAFGPDVVVTELVRDPRWLAFGTLAPRVQLMHDDQAHGADEERPAWERHLFEHWGRRAHRTVCFSDYVADRVRGGAAAGEVSVVPLTSDVADAAINVAAPGERRDFVLIGRLNEYKNLSVIFDAWQRHVDGPAYRSDVLRLYGSAATIFNLPAAAWWNGGTYEYSDVLAALRTAKGSVAHYRVATQSGVQVLSMQLGVTPIVSTRGALPEFQPHCPPPIDPDDIAGLTAVFDALADPQRACDLGAAAHDHYRRRYAAPVAASVLSSVLTEIVEEAR